MPSALHLSRLLLLVAITVCGGVASADRGALTVDVGGGVTGLRLGAPFARPQVAVNGVAPAVWLGGRYALRNELELALGGFYEPPVTYWHHNVTVPTERGEFPGTLTHRMHRYGAVVGARYLHGMVWRATVGLDVGWSRRGYSDFTHLDVSEVSGPIDYELALPAFRTDNFLLAPVVGLEWAAGDHWSLSLLPRVELLLGPDPTVAITVPLTLSWSWYL